MWLYFWANDFPYLSFLTPPCLRRTLQYLSWQLAEPINHKSDVANGFKKTACKNRRLR